MRLIQATLVVLVPLASPAGLFSQALAPAPLRNGEVTFAMRATKVGDFVGHAPVARAEFHGDQFTHVTGWAEVRLVDMHTGIGLRDTHMRNAMRADSFPVIRFDLTSVEPGTAQGDSVPAVLAGHLPTFMTWVYSLTGSRRPRDALRLSQARGRCPHARAAHPPGLLSCKSAW